MAIFTGLLGPSASLTNPPQWLIKAIGGQPSKSGVSVTPESALTISAVYACVKIIAGAVGSLPLITYQRRDDGGKERATGHPLYEVLHDQPNNWQTAPEFWEMVVAHALLRGNGYARIVPGLRGAVDQLIPLHPGRMRVEQLTNGRVRYSYTRPEGGGDVFDQDEMFHLRGLSSDGLVGLSVVGLARESIGLALATEEYGARFFSNGASPSGHFEHPGRMSEEAQHRFLASKERQLAGLSNAHKMMVLEEGMKWTQVGMTHDDAQFLETRDFQIKEVARWFDMPLHRLRDDKTPTFASVEMDGIEFVVHTLRPWLVRIEKAIRRDLITDKARYFAEFLVDGLLRGDTKARYEAYASAILNGWMSRNEARLKENLNPEEGLDVFLVQQNMSPAGEQPQMATLELPPQAITGQVRLLAEESAGRVVRKELQAITKAARRCASDAEAFEEFVQDFYRDHTEHVAGTLKLSGDDALAYCQAHRDAVLWGGVKAMEDWEETEPARLADMALKEGVAE